MAVHMLTGDDQTLLSSALGELVRRLVGQGDRTLMVDEFDGDDYVLAAVVDSAQTPPFLTDRRVVVARGIGRFNAEDAATLVAYLVNPLDSTDLVLSGGGGRLPKTLSDAIKASGAVVTATGAPINRKDKATWVDEQLAARGVRLDAGAAGALIDWLGEEAGRLRGVLETLVSTYGTDRRLTTSDIVPFLGEGGGVPPWDLTDAIDRGDVTRSLNLATRMMRIGDRHPLQIMAVLHGHYAKLLELDGSPARSEADVAEILSMKAGFQAKKLLDQSRKLGGEATRRAIALLAEADLDLRGLRDLPAETVMEVRIARLARLGGASSGGRRR